ncbi:MAG: InlB B-repeat-containing protein [Coriobacteriales bacterium]
MSKSHSNFGENTKVPYTNFLLILVRRPLTANLSAIKIPPIDKNRKICYTDTMKRHFIKWLFAAFIGTLILLIIPACHFGDTPRTYVLRYTVNDDNAGYISGPQIQSPFPGKDAFPVKAVPNDGYVFVGWSDGVQTPNRTDTNVQSDALIIACFEKIAFTIEYQASTGGYIEGASSQNVLYRETSQTVTAVPEKGYMFIGWSDGVTSPSRKESDVRESLSFTALFDRLQKTYTYDDQYSTAYNIPPSVTLHIDRLNETMFSIPQKDYSVFGGWYADKERTIPVTDADGRLLLGQEIFELDTDTFYAKWTAKEPLTYKLLMVFAEEVNASFPLADGSILTVDYKLSPTEKKICEMIPNKFSEMINDVFYGYITFDIDTYWLKNPLISEYFTRFPGSDFDQWGYDLNPFWVPEIAQRMKDYRCMLISYHWNDVNRQLNLLGASGTSTYGYGIIYLDTEFRHITINNPGIEVLLNPEDQENWNSFLDTYFHEFTHVASLQNDLYHNALAHRETPLSDLEYTQLFLLGQADMQGQKVGVAHDYWLGNFNLGIRYWATDGGFLQTSTERNYQIWQDMPYNGNADTITAIPNPGYYFVKWSDGITTPQRTDTNVLATIEIWAIFKKIEQ